MHSHDRRSQGEPGSAGVDAQEAGERTCVHSALSRCRRCVQLMVLQYLVSPITRNIIPSRLHCNMLAPVRCLYDSCLQGHESECVENGLEAVNITAIKQYDLILMVCIKLRLSIYFWMRCAVILDGAHTYLRTRMLHTYTQDCNMPIMDGWQVIFPPVANSKSLFAAATP